MAVHFTKATSRSVALEAVCIRCGCGAPQDHAGSPCPTPRRTENLGRIAFWHLNPLRVLAWRLGRWIRFKRSGTINFTQETGQ